MSAQRYTSPAAQKRMADGRCPECGKAPDEHTTEMLYLGPGCDLRTDGVTERIKQYRSDQEAADG